MKNYIYLLLCFLIGVSAFAQQNERFISLPANQAAGNGESLYAFSVKMRPNKSVVISIDDVKIAHLFDGEKLEIAVPNGRHIVRAYQYTWDTRINGWKEESNDRLTNTLNNVKLLVEVNPGPKLKDRNSTVISVTSNTSNTTRPTTPAVRPGSSSGIEGAVARASVTFVGELPKNSTLAVISISSSDPELANFAIDELEYQLVTARQFTMVDRKTLDTIRSEQKFQLTGEVSDQSAVSIGNLLGASIVVTGSITGIGNTRRLTLKALDVKTAQIVSMSREQF